MTDTDSELARGKGITLKPATEIKALIAVVVPSPDSQPIDEAWLREWIITSGFGHLRYLSSSATALLSHYNAGLRIEVKIAEYIDGTFQVSTTPDDLEVLLDIQPAEGGKPVGKAEIMAALAENGIGEGILESAIEGAVAANFAQGLVIARGIAPEHGVDGRLVPLIPEARNRTPRVDESGYTDYRDLGDIFVVHAGDPLMLRHPPTAGTPGKTLLGATIAAIPGKEVMYAPNLPGTQFASDDPNLLQAAVTGQPVVIRGGMMVEPVFKVEAVNTASGNINFDGSVIITGDVSAGMRVQATGDIQIGGVVEMATLEAGGSIGVKGGVMGGIGRKNVEEHHIQCAACFSATYVQQAKIEAGDSIFIDDMAMQCDLSAINHIRVGNKKRGHIIGGSVQATLSITAKVIGSPNRVRTACEIGVNPLMHKQLLDMCKRRDNRETQLLEVSKLLDFAGKNPGKLKPEMLEKARATAVALSNDIAGLREEQEVLTKKIELSQLSRLTAEQSLYEGVEVLMGALRYRVTGEHGACAVGLTQGMLELLAIDTET